MITTKQDKRNRKLTESLIEKSNFFYSDHVSIIRAYYTEDEEAAVLNCEVPVEKNPHEKIIKKGPLKESAVVWDGRGWMLSTAAEELLGLYNGYPPCCCRAYADGRIAKDVWKEYGQDAFLGIGYVLCKKCCIAKLENSLLSNV